MKNIGILSLLVVATLLFAIAFPAAAGPKPPAPPVPAAPAFAVAPADEHPHISEALQAMRSAKSHLEAAAHDFQGHRSKSLEHLNAAIKEAEVCMTMK